MSVMDSNYTSRPDKIGQRDVKGNRESDLVLHNDDINSFDYVIDTLVEICDHSSVQAEQCTMIAHYKGKCTVRSGNRSEMGELRYRLVLKGLKATIE